MSPVFRLYEVSGRNDGIVSGIFHPNFPVKYLIIISIIYQQNPVISAHQPHTRALEVLWYLPLRSQATVGTPLLRTSPSGIGNSSYFELPEDLQGCDEAALPLSHTKLSVRGGT